VQIFANRVLVVDVQVLGDVAVLSCDIAGSSSRRAIVRHREAVAVPSLVVNLGEVRVGPAERVDTRGCLEEVGEREDDAA
jgi:hypothetical protein